MGRNLSTPTEQRVTVAITADHNILSGEILLIDTTAGTELHTNNASKPAQGDRII